jgi:cytochrome c oxidase assembly protein subunit 15
MSSNAMNVSTRRAGSGEAAAPAGSTPATAAARPDPRPIAYWLLICCALVFAMVVLGGVTRLTGSGLSMVGWEPVSGTIPPLTPEAWETEFERYQGSPEFQFVNYWMTIADFKRIFWFEWAHRLLGRLIGIVFLIPFLFFVAARRVDRALAPKLAAMFVLGGLQGLLGWYMVKSGLVDDPHVSQYRLAAHLAAAVIIYAYMLWVALGLLSAGSPAIEGSARRPSLTLAYAATGLVFLTLVSGAFVAGLKAGLIFNTFPTMQGEWLPAGLYAMQPAYMSLFEDPTTVQFNHRLLALLTLIVALALCIQVLIRRAGGKARAFAYAAAATALVQVGLGIGTLLLKVPVALATAHQAGAVLLFTLVLCLSFELRAH